MDHEGIKSINHYNWTLLTEILFMLLGFDQNLLCMKVALEAVPIVLYRLGRNAFLNDAS